MKLLFLFLMSFSNYVSEPSLFEIRSLYQQAAANESSCKRLVSLLRNYDHKTNAVYAGYRGCATMMMANHLFSPISKYSNFNTGKNLLEKAIASDGENVELRFLRFAVQTNIPFFLGYKSSINSDKLFVIRSYKSITDLQLKQMIASFFRTSEHVSAKEKQMFHE